MAESFGEAESQSRRDGAVYCIERYRSQDVNPRTQLLKIIRKAGVEPWPKPLQNLRASRETELANVFPLHAVTAWLGNTPRVAEKHYLQVTDEHFAQAIAGGGAGGGAQAVPQPAACDRNESQKTRKDKAESAKGASFPTFTLSEEYAWQDSNLRPTD